MRVEIKKLSEAEKRQYVPFAWGLSVQGNEVILKFIGPEYLMEFYIEPEAAAEMAYCEGIAVYRLLEAPGLLHQSRRAI
jgi:hypothetical protein